jgi:hypothetical protein
MTRLLATLSWSAVALTLAAAMAGCERRSQVPGTVPMTPAPSAAHRPPAEADRLCGTSTGDAKAQCQVRRGL